MITTEVLEEKIKALAQQRDNAFAIYHQAIGALGLAEHLKVTLTAKDHMTLDELGQAVCGTVEAIEPVE
jgi:hypothetical protein